MEKIIKMEGMKYRSSKENYQEAIFNHHCELAVIGKSKQPFTQIVDEYSVKFTYNIVRKYWTATRLVSLAGCLVEKKHVF